MAIADEDHLKSIQIDPKPLAESRGIGKNPEDIMSRKLWAALSLLIVVTLALTACGGAAQPAAATEAPVKTISTIEISVEEYKKLIAENANLKNETDDLKARLVTQLPEKSEDEKLAEFACLIVTTTANGIRLMPSAVDVNGKVYPCETNVPAQNFTAEMETEALLTATEMCKGTTYTHGGDTFRTATVALNKHDFECDTMLAGDKLVSTMKPAKQPLKLGCYYTFKGETSGGFFTTYNEDTYWSPNGSQLKVETDGFTYDGVPVSTNATAFGEPEDCDDAKSVETDKETETETETIELGCETTKRSGMNITFSYAKALEYHDPHCENLADATKGFTAQSENGNDSNITVSRRENGAYIFSAGRNPFTSCTVEGEYEITPPARDEEQWDFMIHEVGGATLAITCTGEGISATIESYDLK